MEEKSSRRQSVLFSIQLAEHAGYPTESLLERINERLGFTKRVKPERVRTALFIVAAVVFPLGVLELLPVAAQMFLVKMPSLKAEEHLRLNINAFSAVILVLGVIQWQRARAERSLEHFYDRLEKLNSLLTSTKLKPEEFQQVVGIKLPKDEACTERSWETAFFVFREIDNLECVLEKYRLRLMDEAHVERALSLFQGRCNSAPFLKYARHFSGKDATYMQTTKTVVNLLCDFVEERKKDVKVGPTVDSEFEAEMKTG